MAATTGTRTQTTSTPDAFEQGGCWGLRIGGLSYRVTAVTRYSAPPAPLILTSNNPLTVYLYRARDRTIDWLCRATLRFSKTTAAEKR